MIVHSSASPAIRRLLAMAACLSAAMPAAADARESEVAASIILATDHVWRGLSQTGGEPAIIGEAKWNHKAGPLAGILVSNYRSDIDNASGLAITPFVGFNTTAGGINFDAGYLYRGRTDARGRDYGEVTLSAGGKLGPVSARAGGFYSWDHYLGSDTSYLYLDSRAPLGTVGGVPLTLSAYLGRFDADGAACDYVDMRMGVSARLRPATLAVNVSHADIDRGTARLEGARHGGTRLTATAFFLF